MHKADNAGIAHKDNLFITLSPFLTGNIKKAAGKT
jgi:hypothetical protein